MIRMANGRKHICLPNFKLEEIRSGEENVFNNIEMDVYQIIVQNHYAPRCEQVNI